MTKFCFTRNLPIALSIVISVSFVNILSVGASADKGYKSDKSCFTDSSMINRRVLMKNGSLKSIKHIFHAPVNMPKHIRSIYDRLVTIQIDASDDEIVNVLGNTVDYKKRILKSFQISGEDYYLKISKYKGCISRIQLDYKIGEDYWNYFQDYTTQNSGGLVDPKCKAKSWSLSSLEYSVNDVGLANIIDDIPENVMKIYTESTKLYPAFHRNIDKLSFGKPKLLDNVYTWVIDSNSNDSIRIDASTIDECVASISITWENNNKDKYRIKTDVQYKF